MPDPAGRNLVNQLQSDKPREDRRATIVDRRASVDRRKTEGVSPTGLERRRSAGRRRSDFARAAEEGEMTREQFLFIQAINAFKRVNDTTFPTWTDVLEVFRLLGYRKTQPSALHIPSAEDWAEAPDAPAGVEWDPGKQNRKDRRAA